MSIEVLEDLVMIALPTLLRHSFATHVNLLWYLAISGGIFDFAKHCLSLLKKFLNFDAVKKSDQFCDLILLYAQDPRIIHVKVHSILCFGAVRPEPDCSPLAVG